MTPNDILALFALVSGLGQPKRLLWGKPLNNSQAEQLDTMQREFDHKIGCLYAKWEARRVLVASAGEIIIPTYAQYKGIEQLHAEGELPN